MSSKLALPAVLCVGALIATASATAAPATATPMLEPRTSSEIVLSIAGTIVTGGEISSLVYVGKPSGDRLYVANRYTQDSSIWVIDPLTGTIDDTINAADGFPVDADPTAITVGYDDTVYVNLGPQGSIASINTATNTVAQTVPVAVSLQTPRPVALAVSGSGTTDDTIYVATEENFIQEWVLSFLTAQPFALDDTLSLPPLRDPNIARNSSGGVAVSSDDTVFVSVYGPYNSPGQVYIINGRTQAFDDSVVVGVAPNAIVVTPDDTVYVANVSSRSISVIDGVRGEVVSTINLGLNQFPGGLAYGHGSNRLFVPTVRGFLMAIDTVTNTIDDSITGLGTNPRGITISDDGSRIYVAYDNHANPHYISVISTQPPGPPPQSPPDPPAALTDLVAQAGDRSASLTWTAPAVTGSFPISHYQATSAPGGRTCLVPAPSTACEITALTNGVTYTFTVRALSGAGWGVQSLPSNAVTPKATPRPTIQITGSHDTGDPRVIRVEGMTTGLAGKQVTPWIRQAGQVDYSPGTGVRTVSADGTFDWSRRTSKALSIYFARDSVGSNVLRLSAR